MTDWTEERTAMLRALEPSLGPELIGAFDELLPSRRWREEIPAEQWHRPEVREVVAAHGRARRQLHQSLADLIGELHAGTLMEYLPPAPWAVLVRLGVPVTQLVAVPEAA